MSSDCKWVFEIMGVPLRLGKASAPLTPQPRPLPHTKSCLSHGWQAPSLSLWGVLRLGFSPTCTVPSTHPLLAFSSPTLVGTDTLELSPMPPPPSL